jgi:hypothetical protein
MTQNEIAMTLARDDGDTLLISPEEIPGIDELALVTKVITREIGAWAPSEHDGPDEQPF